MTARRAAPRRGIVLGGGGVLGAAWMIGALSALRDTFAGPGKRVFDLDEVRGLGHRADFDISKIEGPQPLSGMEFPAYCVLATKREFAAEPAPTFMTAKELIARRKPKPPADTLDASETTT